MHTLFFGTFTTYVRCFAGIFSLSLVEAFARAIQLGALGEVTESTYMVLEAPVWLARIGIGFVILGGGNPLRWREGLALLDDYAKRPFGLTRTWRPVLVQTFLFGIFIFVINTGSEWVADGIASQGYAPFLQKPEPIMFFMKNIIVIPLTLVFIYQTFCFIQANSSQPK